MISHASEPVFDGEGRVSDWTFGHACYDLKEELHALCSPHQGESGLPMSHWFVPRWVMEWREELGFLHALPGDEMEARQPHTQAPVHSWFGGAGHRVIAIWIGQRA
jgi:hypothetical protein